MFITVQDPNTPPTPRWRWINQFTMFWRRWSHRSGCLHRSDSRRNLNTRKTCWFKSADVWQKFWLGFFYLKLSDFKQRFCIKIFNRGKGHFFSQVLLSSLQSEPTWHKNTQRAVSRMLSQSRSPTESEPGSLGPSELLQTFSGVVNVCTLLTLDPLRIRAAARL